MKISTLLSSLVILSIFTVSTKKIRALLCTVDNEKGFVDTKMDDFVDLGMPTFEMGSNIWR